MSAWTTEKPTKPGWYWFRHADIHLDPFVVRVTPHGTFTASGAATYYAVNNYKGEWQGPIEPKE